MKGKQYQCCTLETGTFVFGIYSCVVTGFAILLFSAILLFMLIALITDIPNVNFYRDPDTEFYFMAVLIPLSIVFLEFTLAILLTYGVSKKKSGYVQAYFGYGFIKNALVGTISVIFSFVFNAQIGGIILVGCLIYGIILFMIYKTYKQIASNVPYKDLDIEVISEKY